MGQAHQCLTVFGAFFQHLLVEVSSALQVAVVGQGVGLIDKIQSTQNVVYGFKEDFVRSYGRLADFLEDG